MSYGNALVLVLFAALATVVIVVVGRANLRSQREESERQLRVQAAYQKVSSTLNAATDRSEIDLRRRLDAVDVNLQNPDGDSALHLAYYARREDAVARLKACGADETLRNRDGLTPAEMADVAETERLVERTIACMSTCIWLNEKDGRPLYERLKKCSPRVYNPALVRVFLRQAKNQRRVVCLAVKVGLPGSQARLALILDGYGTKEMATSFLNSGSTKLADAARRWAIAHGYIIQYRAGGAVARWGQF